MEKLTLEQQQEILANINKGIIGTRTTGTWNHMTNTDWEAAAIKRAANINYKVRDAKIDWKAKAANTNWKTKVANTDYKAIVAKIDYKAAAEKRVGKIDYKAAAEKRVANTDWKAASVKRVASTDYKTVHAKRSITISKSVLQYDKQGNFIKEFNSAKEAVIAMGRPGSDDIGKCCRGIGKSAYGFIWKFKDN